MGLRHCNFDVQKFLLVVQNMWSLVVPKTFTTMSRDGTAVSKLAQKRRISGELFSGPPENVEGYSSVKFTDLSSSILQNLAIEVIMSLPHTVPSTPSFYLISVLLGLSQVLPSVIKIAIFTTPN